MTLSKELTYTYIKDRDDKVKKTFAGVSKGQFLLYDEGEPNEHTPKEMWSHATHKHQDMLAKAGVMVL